MEESDFVPHLTAFFNAHGFTVTSIPRTDKKTPDFEVSKEGERFLLELKLKGPDMKEVAQEAAQVASGAIVSRIEPLSPWDTLANIIRDGASQLQHHDPNNGMLHLIWLHSWGYEDELLETLAPITLFGMAKLVSSDFSGMMPCYYFRESSFFTQRKSLDAVISTRGHDHSIDLTLCVNTYSPRIATLRASRVFQAFQGGLTDPAAMQEAGEIWEADCDVPRRDQQGVLAYLREKYSVSDLQVMPMTQISARATPQTWFRQQGMELRKPEG
jgi:hypothetical protein